LAGLHDIISVSYVLTVAHAHGKPLPKSLSQQDANLIIILTNYGLTQQFKSQKVSYIIGGQLTNRMIQDLKNAATSKSKYKMTYYSGHDITLLEVMGTLGVTLERSSTYASNLQLELYKDGNEYNVKLRYDGKYIKLPIMTDNYTSSLDALTKYISSLNKKFK
jgi:hypothetical protein